MRAWEFSLSNQWACVKRVSGVYCSKISCNCISAMQVGVFCLMLDCIAPQYGHYCNCTLADGGGRRMECDRMQSASQSAKNAKIHSATLLRCIAIFCNASHIIAMQHNAHHPSEAKMHNTQLRNAQPLTEMLFTALHKIWPQSENLTFWMLHRQQALALHFKFATPPKKLV